MTRVALGSADSASRLIQAAGRRAFTLIELLVAMAVIVTLATLALLIVPDALDNDRTTEGAAIVRQYLMIAKSRAARDQAPRGVRLIVSTDPNNVAKGGNAQWVTELQFIEKLPVYIPAPVSPLIAPTDPSAPRVVFSYSTVMTTIPTVPPVTGPMLISPPTVTIQNISSSDASLIQPGALLSLFNLGFSARITGVSAPAPTNPTNLNVALDFYPDTNLGAIGGAPGTPIPVYVSYQFGITTPPRPLIGEPTAQLPGNICIDLASSSTSFSGVPLLINVIPPGSDFDIVFLPNGQVDPSCSAGGANQLFLWVRDYTKPGGLGGDFQNGGEQQVVSLKLKSGALGAFPISWTGNAFQFAVQGATAP